eukprot:Opistho-2@30510
MKVRNALIIVGLATVATTSFAASAYHASPVQEQGAVFTPDHLGNTVSRDSVRNTVLVAQQDGSLQWISRGYPATYPLVKAPTLTKSRDQVLQELEYAKRNPITADGMRDMGGEAGWVNAHVLCVDT